MILGLHWGYSGVKLGLYWGCIGVILGLYWGCIGIMENKMETTCRGLGCKLWRVHPGQDQKQAYAK